MNQDDTVTVERPAVPAELRRRVLVEAGHRCAIPTCRQIEVDIHHILPWEQCHSHEYENLIALCPNCHRRADRGDIDRRSLRAYKANLRLAHDRFSTMEVDLLFESYRVKESDRYPAFVTMFYRRVIDAGYIMVSRYAYGKVGTHEMYGIDMMPITFSITPKGRQYVESFGETESTGG